ncbi:MAG: ABC transporter ATP-binding protein [Magnetospirillum sp.]|nr:ABC transporter ATP-binding protein [Magnetospirillum sp.]
MLLIEGLVKHFRGLRAVDGVSFRVEAGEIVALIGPNGAGKTTVFNMIAGVFEPDGGRVELEGRSLIGLRPDQVCRAGVGRTFQLVKPFGNLSVEENVVVGALRWTHEITKARAQAREVLDLLGLADKRRQPARSLTLPDRKCLEVARALATKPKLLLLDEVMAGLRPAETDRMVETFRRLNRETGLTIVLIEHVMRAVMALSQRVVVINSGQPVCEGTPEEVVRDPRVLDCYLGEEPL